MVWDEVTIVVSRTNAMLATETTLLHQVMTVAVGAFGKDGGKAAHDNLLKTLKRLTADGS